MANENYITYNGVNIAAYTDTISVNNPMSSEFITDCVNAAGSPASNANLVWVKNINTSALNYANSNNPWNNGSTGIGVLHEVTDLIDIPTENWTKYVHTAFLYENGIIYDMDLSKFRIIATIAPVSTTVYNETVHGKMLTVGVQYGSGNDWHDISITPVKLFTESGDILCKTVSYNPLTSPICQFIVWWGDRQTSTNQTSTVYGSVLDGQTVIPSNVPFHKNNDMNYELQSETDYQIYTDDYYESYLYGSRDGGFHANSQCILNSESELLFNIACCGLKFVCNGVTYKPIVNGGVVTGYTDDMTKTSEWDNWENINDHTIPVTPPAPVPPVPDKHDNEIEMDLSHYSTLNGFIQYYLMGISTVDDLAAAMNRFDITLIGKDLLPNLISYKMFAIPSANFSTGTTRTITIAGHEMKKVNDDPIQAPIVLDITPITLDTITIPHTYNDFRDYDPYTKIEMFVPFCGWFTLPPWCMGRSISGTMYIDLPNGTVKAVIKASQTVVAEIGGSCAVDVPFVAQSVGSKTAAVISNMANGLIATADPTPQSFVSSSMGIATALNRNYTQCKGVMGDGSNVQGLNRIYIKVTRPAPTETLNGEISARYKHERGLPCGKFLTLAKGDGFTQITDANITGNMTAHEKQMIIDGFRHGLIL